MKLEFGPRGILQIDDARLMFKNFSGEADKYNVKGNRNFVMMIPEQEMAEALTEDKNEYGVGWNVKIKPPREEGDAPFMYLPVKVKFNGRGPVIWLESGSHRTQITEETAETLDKISIARVDLDIRPYDGISDVSGEPFRAAYLQSMCVTQEMDRFSERFAEEEYPE